MSRVESLPNRTKPRINHRAGVSSRSRARSSSHLGAYKVFVFAQIPSHRILQRLLQRPHGRLFQVCAADDVREQSRDLALRVLHRVVVFVRVHGARAGLTSPRARGHLNPRHGACEFFFDRANLPVGRRARTVCPHDAAIDRARGGFSRARVIERVDAVAADRRRLDDSSSTTTRAASSARTTSDDEGNGRERKAIRDGATRGTMRLTFYTKMGGRLTPRRAAGRSGEREAP